MVIMPEAEGIMKEIHTRTPVILSGEDGEHFVAGRVMDLPRPGSGSAPAWCPVR